METNYTKQCLPVLENIFKTHAPAEEEVVMKGFLQKYAQKTPAPKDLADKIRSGIKFHLSL